MALDFDLRKVVSLVGPKRTFALVAIKLFRRNGFIVESQAAKLHKNRDMVSFCTSSTFFHWVGAVEKGYLNHPYHNSVHATDVMCASNSYLIHSGLHSRINNASFGGGGGFDNLSWQLAQFSLLVAAAVHDIGHIGVSNAYLKSVNHPLCIEYPDTIGVLEAMHAATALAIFRTPGNNIVECMSNANAQLVRENIVELVLVTDLSKQADFLKKWNARRTPPPEGSNAKGKWDILLEGSSPKASEDRMLFLKLMLKAADVSNPVKNTDLYLFWTDNIIEEFYRQGDMEREAGLPVTTMPNCDRNQPGLAQGQIGFLSFMVKPTYDAIMLFLNDQPPPKRRSSLGWGGKDSSSSRLDPVMANLDTNLAFWKNMKLSPEEASKVRFPRDLPERYLTQAQRNVFGSKTETETLQSEDELAKEFERQKVALVSRSAQSWMDDASCLPSAESTTEERDALASEFERQRLGGKPRSPQISFFERSAQRSDFFMDTYSLLFIRFTPHGRHFYSLDMIRKLLFAVTIALTSSPQSHKMRLLQTLLALIIALGWTIFQMVDIVCCRYWVSRVELLSSLVIVVMLAVVLVWIDSDEDVDSPHSNSLSDMLILIFLVCFGIDILFLAIDQAFIQRLCTMPKRNVNSYNNQDLEGGDDVRISLELPTSTSESIPAPEDQAQAAEDSKMVRRLSFDKINLSTLPTSSQVQEITKTTPKKTTKKKNKTSPFNKMEEPSTSEIDAVVEVAVKHTFGSRL
jgi:hypothetical protein